MLPSLFDHCYFSGIAGGGMSAVAQYLRFSGRAVAGSDRSFDRGAEAGKRAYFEGLGIRLYAQDGLELTADHTALILSTAIEPDHPEIRRAQALSLPILHRSDLLAALAAEKKTLAVAGTSGKSTVTGMLYHILVAAGWEPGLITGANLLSLRSQGRLGNAAAGAGAWLVIEADESDGSVTRYHPEVGLVLNIEKDHKEIAALLPLFQTFVAQSRRAVLNGDDARCAALRRPEDAVFTQSTAADARLNSATFSPWSSHFTLDQVPFVVHLPGRHNVINALAAVAAARLLGIPLAACARGLDAFAGVERRWIKVGEAHGITVIDDFAHNPAKVKAALATAKDLAIGLNRRVLAIFHPHGFAPMKLMGFDIMDAAAEVLGADDLLFVPDIYYAGGTAEQSLGSADLVAHLNARKRIGVYLSAKSAVLEAVAKAARPGDVVLSMGARDPDLEGFAHALLQRLATTTF